ncbi:MAG: hypothetical protein ACXABY_03660 [Candidatus Thorarchaeota archaeon]|jgi:hypothetical protein
MKQSEVDRIKELYRSSNGNLEELYGVMLKIADDVGLDVVFKSLEAHVIQRRDEWLDRHLDSQSRSDSVLEDAFHIFYEKYLGLSIEDDGEIIHMTNSSLVSRWWNQCPVLEVCEKLGLDTREVCHKVYDRPVQTFLSRIDSRLVFERNYDCIRPYTPYCEETLTIKDSEEID